MTRKDLDDLKKYFKDIYPHIYDKYKFLFDIRTKDPGFGFLLAFESLLLTAFVTLFGQIILNGELLFIVPTIAFLISILFSLYNLIPRQIWFPWFEARNIKEAFEGKEEKDFYEEGLRSIYGVLDHLREFSKRKDKIFFGNFIVLYIALVLSFTSVLIYYGFFIWILLFIPIAILFWTLIQKNWGRGLVPKSPAPEVEKFFDDWKKEVENNKTKTKNTKNN